MGVLAVCERYRDPKQNDFRPPKRADESLRMCGGVASADPRVAVQRSLSPIPKGAGLEGPGMPSQFRLERVIRNWFPAFAQREVVLMKKGLVLPRKRLQRMRFRAELKL
jgi:hypothetical protein